MNNTLTKYKDEYRNVQIGLKSVQRVLNGMKNTLEDKKQLAEHLRVERPPMIPMQFLASEKLAMNKKKFSPKKFQKIAAGIKRSNSSSK